MNKLSAVSLSVLLMVLLSLVMAPNVLARAVWTKTPPFPSSYANAWRGDHWPERDTWWARASADRYTGVMKANIHSYIDAAGWLNTYFETSMIDYVSITKSGTMYITGTVFLKGHAHIYGISVIAGGYTVAYQFDLWLIVDDTTTATNVLNWKVNTWEDSETAVGVWLTDRGFDFNWDYAISQTSLPVTNGHTYKVTVKLTGWAGVTVVALAAAQSDIDFETGDYQMKLKWLTYDAPSGQSSTPGCVAEGTPVTMADGTVKPIEKIKKGDQVLGYDPITGSYMAENVLDTIKHQVEVMVNINNGMLKLTPLDQPIFIRNSTYEGWMRDPADIQVGWEIYEVKTNGWVPVTSITYEEGKTRVYDLVLDGYTTYIANGILLMDKC